MSVINKMLRDLDSRQAGGPAPVATPAQGMEARPGVTRHTLSVKRTEPPGRQMPSLARTLQLVTTVLAVLGVAAWWYLNQSATPQPVAASTGQAAITATPPVAPVVPSSSPVATSSATGASPAVGTVTVSVATKPAVVSRPQSASLPAAVAVPAPKLGAAYLDFSLKMETFLQRTPSPAVVARPPVAGIARAGAAPTLAPAASSEPGPAPTVAAKTIGSAASTSSTAPPGPARASAAQEALAQAQSLWDAGSRAAAIDLLHEALTLAERANQAGVPAGGPSVVAAIARELARMELAEGRVSQVLVLLTRLEPVLSGVADIWAIRGNAAQRLGQHPASAAAYLMALKLRPNEPRWMLGVAVSLAAQGQTAAAAELAEKARDGGALTPDVANYLRQLGVPLRER